MLLLVRGRGRILQVGLFGVARDVAIGLAEQRDDTLQEILALLADAGAKVDQSLGPGSQVSCRPPCLSRRLR